MLGALSETADIYPHEVGAFERIDMEPGQMFGEHLTHHEVVVMNIVAELIEPLLPFPAVCCLKGKDTEGVDITYFVLIDGTVDTLAHFAVGCNDIGYLESGNVEGFARRHTYCGMKCKFVAQRCERCVGSIFGIDEFAMYLVAENKDPVLHAYVAHAEEFVACPHPSYGVMRIAEDEEFHSGVAALPFEFFPVDRDGIVLQEFVLDDGASVVPDAGEETVIDGRLDEYLVARTGHCLDDS